MIRLLEEIAVTGNVRKACENMRVSYSKGWKLLRIIEECAGIPLVTKKHGGPGGGSAALTEEGMVFIEKYRNYVAECTASMEHIFTKIWGAP
jgi:molybdate transport system regulatory protein